MAFVTRKPFTFKGTKYRPGDVVVGFPEEFYRPEGFIRTGFIVEKPDSEVVSAPKRGRKPKAKKAEPVVEVFAEPVAVEEQVIEEFVVSEEPADIPSE